MERFEEIKLNLNRAAIKDVHTLPSINNVYASLADGKRFQIRYSEGLHKIKKIPFC